MSDIQTKDFTTSIYQKFTSEKLNAKAKEKGYESDIDKSDISGFIGNSDFYKKIATLAAKAELKAEQHKIDDGR